TGRVSSFAQWGRSCRSAFPSRRRATTAWPGLYRRNNCFRVAVGETSAQAPGGEELLCGAQWRSDPPACRVLYIVDVFAQFFVACSSRSAIRVCEQPNRPIDVQPRSQKLGKTLGRVDGDIVQAVELVDNYHLDHLVDTARPALL